MQATGNGRSRAKLKTKRKRYIAVMKREKRDKNSPEYKKAEAMVRALDLPPAPPGQGSKRG